MFSAPTGYKQSSAGYDTTILTKLIRKWRDAVTECGHLYSFAGVVFCPYTAIKNTDLKQRGPLIAVIPSIWLLICRFHLRQSWKNHRNKLLKGKGALKVDLKHRLKRLEDSLVKTQTIEEACGLLAQERELLTQFGERRKPIRKALEHLDYLRDYWTTDNLWKSWSDYGRKVAASLLGCEMDAVIPTTNHLESFNVVLKRKHLRRWQNGGRRIRVDVLIQILIIHILQLRIAAQVRLLPRGANLLKNRSTGRQTIPKIAYLVPDKDREQPAQALFSAGQVGVPEFQPGTNTFVFTCLSAEVLEIETAPVKYTVTAGVDGVVTCMCPDFEKQGGACKHIRGAFLMLDGLRDGATGMNIPAIPIPTSLVTADNQLSLTVRVSSVIEVSPELVPEREIEEEDSDRDIDTDASSDSGDDDDEDDSVQDRASVNLAALGEQALARTIYELDEIGPRAGDLAEFLKHRSGPVSAAERECLSRGRGHLAAMMAETDRSLFSAPAPVLTQSLVEATQKAAPTASQNGRKRQPNRTLQAPSPERAQKRHQSYAAY
ncbi:hypothetical protein B0H19DRAFT_1213716 [Mycena capillaripes]|nr:hypothetical protein B0H19DRAFT_1213716 [Mycena capillaripes]